MIKLKINMTTNPNYYSKALIVYVMKLKPKMSMKISAAIKNCLISAIIQLSQNTMIIQTKLVIGKIKDETWSVAIDKFFRFKLKIYSFLADNSEHKKAKGMNRNVVATKRYN